MMRKSLIFSITLLVILLFLCSGINCRRHRTEEETTPKEISQKEAEKLGDIKRPIGKQRRRAQEPQVVGRGNGRRGLGRGRGGGEYEPVELSADEKEAIEIETVTASFKPLKSHLQAMGKVLAHPLRKAIVSYAFPARISQVHIRIGDWVKAGQRLVILQSEEVGKAKSEFYKAQADHELAKVNFEREKRLFDRGVGAKKNYLAAEAEFKVAQASLNAAEKKLHVLGFTEEQVKTISETHQINPIITLFAPIRGKIIDNKAILGAMIDQETEILTIMDPTVLCIDAEIYEKDIAKIRIGQEVEVTVPAYPGETFIGKIRYISDVLHEETRTITVRTEVENKGYKLKPGMFADIKIFLNHQSQTLVVPEEALLDEQDEKIVFIKKEGKYLLQIVETGTREKGYVEILSGLQQGDIVVTKGNYQLKSKLYEEILGKAHVH
jgi:cobalt-zinc-cadmium efflux system membrane fusion protein